MVLCRMVLQLPSKSLQPSVPCNDPKIKLRGKKSFFVTIASVLGTGILGLPVKTADSGFFPFLVIFVIVLIFEVGI